MVMPLATMQRIHRAVRIILPGMRPADQPDNPQDDDRLRAIALRKMLREALMQLDGMGANLAAAHLAACIDSLNRRFDLD
ncbi:hypothetical protein [Novosphingobium sp.]|uniref:hypothetical protein n=1 Tax=Novosphingobium sp. TaxID=1874826 RepID=UPI0031D3168E